MDSAKIDELLQNAPYDPQAGIRLVRVGGDSCTAVFAAQIDPRVALKAHYHESGDELYFILEGEGVMHTAARSGENAGLRVSFPVTGGDVFTVPEGCVHSLENRSCAMLRALFVCAPEHVSTDRFFTEDQL